MAIASKKSLFFFIVVMLSGDCLGMHKGEQNSFLYDPAHLSFVPGCYGNPAIGRLPVAPVGSGLEPVYIPQITQGIEDHDFGLAILCAEEELEQRRKEEVAEQERASARLATELSVQEAKRQEALELAEQWRNKHEQEAKKYSQPLQQQEKSQSESPNPKRPIFALQQQKPIAAQSYNHSSGFSSDSSLSKYDHAAYIIASLGTTHDRYIRKADHSGLFVLRCGNTYTKDYQEKNEHSSVFEIGLFNTYEGKRYHNNHHSSCLRLLLGDKYTQIIFKNHHSKDCTISLSRERLAALVVAGIALKVGTAQACLAAVGIAAPGLFVVPMVLGGALVFPVFMAVGATFMIIGFTTLAVFAAGTAITVGGVLLPVAVPVLLLKSLWG